jgi:hypothetical protein
MPIPAGFIRRLMDLQPINFIHTGRMTLIPRRGLESRSVEIFFLPVVAPLCFIRRRREGFLVVGGG